TAPAYLSGIESLIELGVASRTAFMCSEADFHHCHRYHLITRTLVNRGVEVQHITHSGELAGSTKGEFEPAQPSLFCRDTCDDLHHRLHKEESARVHRDTARRGRARGD